MLRRCVPNVTRPRGDPGRFCRLNGRWTEMPEAPECPLREFVTAVRSVQEKFGRLSESHKDIAATLSRAAARLRAMSVARN